VWPLAMLMAGATAETLATVAERIAGAALPRNEREELTGLLVVLAGLRLTRPVVEQVLGRSPMIRDLLSESSIVELWREEGEAKGKAEGEARGEAKGQRAMAQAVLESRFGPLDAAEAAALQAADEPALRALAAHLATASREQIRARLGVA